MHLEFMKPELWDALVAGITIAGLALAVSRLVKDRASYRQQQNRSEDHPGNDR